MLVQNLVFEVEVLASIVVIYPQKIYGCGVSLGIKYSPEMCKYFQSVNIKTQIDWKYIFQN